MTETKDSKNDSLQDYLKQLQKKGQLPFSADNFLLLSDKGQHNVYEAVGKNGKYIVRIPKTIEDNPILKELEHESAVTKIISRYDLSVPTSEIKIFSGQQPFAWHREVEGIILTQDVYNGLSNTQKDIFAKDIAVFLNRLHTIPLDEFKDVPPQINPKSFSKDFLENHFNYPEARKALQKYNINLDDYKTTINEDKVLCHNDLHGENLVIYSQAEVKSSGSHILKGVFDFGNAEVSNRSFDFIKLVNLDRKLSRSIINEYNHISLHKISQKEIDYQYLCWQALNLTAYDKALNQYNNDLKNNKISQQQYSIFLTKYDKFQQHISGKLISFRTDVAREKLTKSPTDDQFKTIPSARVRGNKVSAIMPYHVGKDKRE